MKRYEIALDEELLYVKRAVQYYQEWGEEIDSSDHDWEYLKKYYAGYKASPSSILFRALFFAMRIQPVMLYIEQFLKENKRPPYLLDIGCGFGMEAILLSLYGARVHGVDVSKRKIEFGKKIAHYMEQKRDTQIDIDFSVENLFRFNPLQLYDAVYSSATLHHIEPVQEAFHAISTLIKPNGYFFLSDENGLNLAQQLLVQKRIGFENPRKLLMTDSETGEQFMYGNENIRAPYLWARYLKVANLHPVSIKYCRFMPPLDWSLSKFVKVERRLRSIPFIAELGSIGFLLTTQKIKA